MQHFIKNNTKFQQTIQAMQQWWGDKLHILADFDRTLTKGFYKGKKVSSIASFLYQGDYLCKEYQEKAQLLFDHYYPIEQNPSIDRSTKKEAMQQWRSKHLDLMIEYKLSKNDIIGIIQEEALQLRNGYEYFFDIINRQTIPLVIMSASGIGYDAIDVFFQHKNIDQTHITIISNQFMWDEKGYAIGREEPVIHSLNKSETTIQQFPELYEKVQDRTNVILMWDSLHDREMIDGFVYDNLITIGRCHSDDAHTKKHYCNLFDIVVFDDWPLGIVNDIIDIISN